MPESPEADLDFILKEVEKIAAKYGRLHSREIKPVAFGLKAVEAAFLLNDSRGGMDEIESSLQKIRGVGSVEMLDVNRL